MKNIFALTFAIIVTFSLVACGDVSNNQVLEELKQEEQVVDEREQSTEEPKQEEQMVDGHEQSIEEPDVEEPVVKQSMVDSFIEEYNATAPTPITDAVEINVTDEESGHYRTEFRLGAFKDSIAKTGKIGDIVIDIVNCGWQKDELRIYADNITPEQAVEIVKYAAPVMDPDVPSDALQDVLDYLSGTNPYHNGYFGNLCMSYNEVYGQLMLRTD